MMQPIFRGLVHLGVAIGTLISGASAYSDSGAMPLKEGWFSLPSLRKILGNDSHQRAKSAELGRLAAQGRELRRLQDHFYGGILTEKYQQFVNGIEVIGGKVMVHQTKEDFDFQDESRAALGAPVAKLLPIEAVRLAEFYSTESTGPSLLSQLEGLPKLKYLASLEGDQAELVYFVEYRSTLGSPGKTVILRAGDGSLVGEVSKLETLTPIQVYSGSSARTAFISPEADTRGQTCKVQVQQDSRIVREETGVTADKCRQILDGLAEISKTSCQVILTTMGFPTAVKVENCTKGFEEGKFYLRDEPVVKAKENVEATLGYFENRFNRRSFDGQGTRALSLVHAGSKMNNAGWYTDMALMVYGEGDGVRFNDFTKAVDVAGHEMAHGVVSHSAKLMMMDESGALNEAIADYFGKRVEGGNGWTIGKGLFRDDPEKGLRDLEEPGRLKHRLTPDGSERSYPKRYSERMTTRSACDSSNDRCFVHINSTIMGHVFYRMDRELGSETAEEILYTALTQFWSERTGFKTAGKNLQSVCRMRFGKLSQQCTTLDRILKEAEI